MKTRPAVVFTTLAAEKGRGLTERISIGFAAAGKLREQRAHLGQRERGPVGFDRVLSMPCVFAVAIIAYASQQSYKCRLSFDVSQVSKSRPGAPTLRHMVQDSRMRYPSRKTREVMRSRRGTQLIIA